MDYIFGIFTVVSFFGLLSASMITTILIWLLIPKVIKVEILWWLENNGDHDLLEAIKKATAQARNSSFRKTHN